MPAGATLHWTLSGPSGATFTVRGRAGRGPAIAVSSHASHGSVAVAAGSYSDVAVRTTGRWTLVVAPRT